MENAGDHIPMGEIMTVRREVYRRSAEVRRQINQQPQREPSSPNEVFDLGQRCGRMVGTRRRPPTTLNPQQKENRI